MTQAQRDIEQLRMSATLALDEAVDKVRLVSPARAKALAGLGIFTVRDLLHHFPRRYIDLSSKETVRSARIGENCTIEGIIHDIRLKRPKPKLQLVEIDLVDETGILLITAFRQPWLMDSLSKGMRLAVAGKLEFNFGYKRMTNPFIEVLGDVNDAAGMVIPVHPATEKISTAWMRRLITNALEKTVGLYDPLPVDLRIKRKLMSKETALARIHFPQNILQAQQARQRLAYEEILNLELFLIRNSKEREEGKTPVQHNVQGKFMHALEAVLPFALTGEQAAARDDILREMAANKVMNHLLLGDVGTGKTVVAAHAVAAVADSGGQALFMVPTEVLAQQHGKSLGQLFDAAGIISEVVTGSTPASEKAAIAGAGSRLAPAPVVSGSEGDHPRRKEGELAASSGEGRGARCSLFDGNPHSSQFGISALWQFDFVLYQRKALSNATSQNKGLFKRAQRFCVRRRKRSFGTGRTSLCGVSFGGEEYRRAEQQSGRQKIV